MNLSIDERIHNSETFVNQKITYEAFKEALEKIKMVLRKGDLIIKILKEISYKELIFGKEVLYKLIIPLKERLYTNQYNINELFKFHGKNLYARDKDELIKVFLDKLFHPEKFNSLSNMLLVQSKHYRENFYDKFSNIISEIKENNENMNNKQKNIFIKKYYIEKMKNKHSVGIEIQMTEETIIV